MVDVAIGAVKYIIHTIHFDTASKRAQLCPEEKWKKNNIYFIKWTLTFPPINISSGRVSNTMNVIWFGQQKVLQRILLEGCNLLPLIYFFFLFCVTITRQSTFSSSSSPLVWPFQSIDCTAWNICKWFLFMIHQTHTLN